MKKSIFTFERLPRFLVFDEEVVDACLSPQLHQYVGPRCWNGHKTSVSVSQAINQDKYRNKEAILGLPE